MVVKDDPRKLLELLGTRHHEADPDEEFLDRLAKKTSFYEQPSAPPEALHPPPPPGSAAEAAAALDALADIQVADGADEEEGGDEAGPHPLRLEPAQQDAAQAAEEQARRAADRELREARYAALFDGRSAGRGVQAEVPKGISLERVSAQPAPQQLPAVGAAAVSAEQAEEEAQLQQEDEARRAAWAELNWLREQQGHEASEKYRKAHERFVATFGHRGAELRK